MSEHEHMEHTEQTELTELTSEPQPTIWEAGRHPVNTGQLVMGLALLGMVAIWALWSSEAVDGGDVRWLLPLPFVLAGAAGLVASTVSGAARRDRWS